MNENLRRLMVQADYPAPEIAKRAQELAELIVRECITKVEEAAEYSPELYGVALDIAEHFGI